MNNKVCTRCESVGRAKAKAKGNLITELGLWAVAVLGVLFTPWLLLVALVYSVWRLGNRAAVCRQCGADALVPLDSPAGRRLVAKKST